MSSRKKAQGNRPLRPENEPQWLRQSREELFVGSTRTDNKTLQLCSQVEEAISCALLYSTNPILRDLCVKSVESVRGVALMRVLVTMEPDAHNYEQTTLAIERAKGYFRGEVARDIHRKRVPSLVFVVVPNVKIEDGGQNE